MHMHCCIFPFLFISSNTFHSCPLLLKLHNSIQTCSHTMGTHNVEVCNWSFYDVSFFPLCSVFNNVFLYCPVLFPQPQRTNLIQPEDESQTEKMKLRTLRVHTQPPTNWKTNQKQRHEYKCFVTWQILELTADWILLKYWFKCILCIRSSVIASAL